MRKLAIFTTLNRKSPEPLNSVFKPSVTFAEPPKDSSSSESQSSDSSEDDLIRSQPDAEENEEPLQENISVRHPFRTFASVASPPVSVTVERPTSKIVEQATSIRRDSRGREIDLEEWKKIILKILCCFCLKCVVFPLQVDETSGTMECPARSGTAARRWIVRGSQR